MTQRSQILFTQGGKGGVGKTTVIAALTGWIRTKGLDPVLLDFDSENREKSSFQSFYPEAQKIDIRAPDSLDRVFHFLETPGTIVIADQGAGSGAEGAGDSTTRGLSDLRAGVASAVATGEELRPTM